MPRGDPDLFIYPRLHGWQSGPDASDRRRNIHQRRPLPRVAVAVGCGGADRRLHRKGTAQVISGRNTHRPDFASSRRSPGRSAVWGEPIPACVIDTDDIKDIFTALKEGQIEGRVVLSLL